MIIQKIRHRNIGKTFIVYESTKDFIFDEVGLRNNVTF